jgi:hypothetical protein
MAATHRYRGWLAGVMLLALAAASLAMAADSREASVDELKARVASAAIAERPKLCVQIAQKQLDLTDRLYTATDFEKAQAALADVTSYAELARDFAIQSRKHEKETEIAVRGMIRKLNGMLHALAHDDQGPVRDALNRLQQVREDLLKSMFPKSNFPQGGP